jgi:thioesterase domain-containing protein/acyl carrier protein
MSEVSQMLAASAPGVIAQASGSVGSATAPWRVLCLDDGGNPLPAGAEGQLAATGGIVNPTIGPEDCWMQRTHGAWFLTGDRGRVDRDGQVHVTGRVDERINRGGKKIAPSAIESVLATHPEVDQAVAFPIPDAMLGERIAVAVIPVSGCRPGERVLRTYLAERLPDYMVPDRVLAVESLPTSATGKIVRRSLAGRFADALAQPEARTEPRFTPATGAEREVARLVAAALQHDGFDLEAELEDIGGNSFLALELLVAIEQELGCQLSPAEFLANQSVAGLARLLDQQRSQAQPRRVVPLRTGTGGPVLFLAHSVHGANVYFHAALQHIDPDITVHGLLWERSNGGEVTSLERHAASYLHPLRAVQPSGPYCLAGHSFAAHLALELAQQLFEAGEHVAFLGILDDEVDLEQRRFDIRGRTPVGGIEEHARHMLECYIPQVYPGDVWLYRASESHYDCLPDPTLGWCDIACGAVHQRTVPGNHDMMVGEALVGHWIGAFQESLRAAWQAAQRARDGTVLAARETARTKRNRPDIQARNDALHAAKNGDLANEIAHHRAAIAFDPDQPFWVYRNLAEALAQSGDAPGSIDAYRVAAGREAIPIVGYGLLGAALKRAGRRAEAEEAFRAAESFETPDLLVQQALVRLEHRRGRPDQAEMRLRRLVAATGSEWSYRRLSVLLGSQGRFDEAIEVAGEMCDRYSAQPDLQAVRDDLIARRAAGA